VLPSDSSVPAGGAAVRPTLDNLEGQEVETTVHTLWPKLWLMVVAFVT
jgi:hypothetical protein